MAYPYASHALARVAGPDLRIQLLAALLTGKNLDETAYTGIPISGSITATTAVEPASVATLSNVNDNAASVTLLAANAARLGASIFNDSDQAVYVKFGITASATSFTVKIAAGGYYELPPNPLYTGRIDGIWVADSTGAARITELTA